MMATHEERRQLGALFRAYETQMQAALAARNAYVRAATAVMRRDGKVGVAIRLECNAVNHPQSMASELEWLDYESEAVSP